MRPLFPILQVISLILAVASWYQQYLMPLASLLVFVTAYIGIKNDRKTGLVLALLGIWLPALALVINYL